MEEKFFVKDNSRQVSPQLDGGLCEVNDSRPKGYSHDGETKTGNPEWMSKLPDSMRLSELSVIGTHDTMAFYGGDAVQCQSMSLQNQLLSGIRFIDIRCKHVNDIFAIYHGIVSQNATFSDVLNTVCLFLKDFPSETVFMRVKEEDTPSGNTRTFSETFEKAYWEPYGQYFWQPGTDTNPSLSELRGKIVVMQAFDESGKTFGLLWNSFNIQDDYKLNTNWDLYDKWEKVKKQLNETASSKKIVFNFLSGSTGSFPYFVASGQSSPQTNAPRLMTGRTTPGWKDSWPDFPRVNCFIGICSIAFEGTNNLIINYLKGDGQSIKKAGFILADFPGPELIDTIIKLND